MYKIIGVDQKEYGPVTGEQLRQWFAEGRVDARTSIRAEGDSNWKTLSAFPEFADLLGNVPPPISSAPPPLSARGSMVPGIARARALQEMSGPAIMLMVISGLGIAFAMLGLGTSLLGIGMSGRMYQMPQFRQNAELMRFLQIPRASGGAHSASLAAFL